MKQVIWVYVLCYNEIHFVRNFFTAYKDADRIILYDSYSTDGTTELAESLGATIFQIDTGDQLRDDIFTDIKNNCWKEARGKADWVIIVDFDEIFNRIVKEGDKITCDIDLTKPYNEGYNIIKPYGYNMISVEAPLDTDDHPFIHSQKGTYHPPAEKLCCFRPDQISEINYDHGSHLANPLDINGGTDSVRIYNNKDYKLLHYIAWNYELYMEKMRTGRRRLSNLNKKNGWGYQYLNTDEQNSGMFFAGLNIAKYIFDI